ncbi:MAG: hypothetical protein K2X27_03625, partial [Candidatus Obscuribacterales bacterium]|nr:hypothetical protein [Candidatus Obscuribacterales bacterium]
DDYMAVAIARRHKLSDLAQYQDDEIHEGLAELVLALLKALNGPFHSEHQLNAELEDIALSLNEMALRKPSPRKLAAVIRLNKWLQERGKSHKVAILDLSEPEHYQSIKKQLKSKAQSASELGQLKHALNLSAEFKLTELSSEMLPLLSDDSQTLPELISCLASLGHLEAVPKIRSIIEKRVNLKERCSQSFSAHPVFESDQQSSLLYWTALKALGSLPHNDSIEILSLAVSDYAPDKREQALLSLQTILLSDDLRKSAYKGNLSDLIKDRLDDPAVAVQSAALHGIAQHKLADLVPEVLKSLHSRESVIQRKARETLISLAENGYRKELRENLESALSKEFDSSKKQRLNKVIQSVG